MLLYADDILLYRAIRDYRDLISIYKFATQMDPGNCLPFNVTKCKYLLISHKRQPLVPPVPLNINDLVIKKVDHFKYLGVWLSHSLTWNKHIEEICKNASKQIGMIYRKFYQNSSKEALANAAICVIHSTTFGVCRTCVES